MELQIRAGYRSQITKIAKEASEYLCSTNSKIVDNIDPAQLNDIEEELASFLQRLNTAHQNLCTINKEVQGKNLEDKNPEKIAEYEDTAIGVISRLQVRLQKAKERLDPCANASSSEHTTNSPKSHYIRLPKLELKKFSGDYGEWIPFWENFRTAVHENSSLSGVEKFNYLQSVLTGVAEKVISGFTPSDACYDGAIALLQEEYGDTDQLIDRLMQQLMNLAQVHNKTDAVGLRQLYNSVISSSRSLTALGVPSSHYYIMLKSVLLRCMPSELRIQYHRTQKETMKDSEIKEEDGSTQNSESGSTLTFDGDKQLKNILLFLKQEVESIEKASVGKTSKLSLNKFQQSSTAAGLLTATNYIDNCFFCKSTDHTTKECNSAYTIEEKKKQLKDGGRCFRCTQRGHNAKFCRVKAICKCCNRNHATVVCEKKYGSEDMTTESSEEKISNGKVLSVFTPNGRKPLNVFLQTARLFLSGRSKKKLFVRVIIDGGSQRSYIKEDIVNKLNIPIVGKIKLSIIPFGDAQLSNPKEFKLVDLVAHSQFNKRSVEIRAVVVPEICQDVLMAPNRNIAQFKDFTLADSNDSNYVQEDGLGLLVGADYYWQIVTGECRKISNRLAAVSTIFGWTIQGPCAVEENIGISEVTSSFCNFAVEDMWNLEVLGIQKEQFEADSFTEELKSQCIRKTSSRYEAVLPWKNSDRFIANNRGNALSRLHSLTRKLSRDPQKLFEYDIAMREFIAAGFAEPIVSEVSGRLYYMPHRPVYRPEKATTRLRIVFDASSRSEGMLSLNDSLWTGPNLLPEILKLILQFRLGEIAIIADIEKAFLQISLAERDRDSHRFLWFKDRIQSISNLPPIKEFRMTRVTFGVTCSPFLLSACIQQHLQSESSNFPWTFSLLRNCFYMDDIITSFDSPKQAKRFHQESVAIMGRAHMNLRKWVSNDPGVRRCLDIENNDAMQMVLGLKWNIHSDELTINMNKATLSENLMATKRNILKVIASIFDPLGFLAPIVIRLKLLFQTLWQLKLGWDELLTADLANEWFACVKGLDRVAEFPLPRWISISPGVQLETHIFADASSKAFGAVAYVRIVDTVGKVKLHFVCAKARVAPLKGKKSDELTLPKLELTAALVAARLKLYFQKLNLPFGTYVLWTDSQITFHWVRGEAKKWKSYVFNRVKEIQELTERSEWRYCPGKQNPADLLTRGISVNKFEATSEWKDGPVWLRQPKSEWPAHLLPAEDSTVLFAAFEAVEEVNPSSCRTAEALLDYETVSSWKRLLRITVCVFRAVDHFRGKHNHPKFIETTEMKKAEHYWLRFIQKMYFPNEILYLLQKKPIPRSSKLLPLNPFLDDDGLVRVGSRLQLLDEPFDVVNPILIPKGSHLSKLLVTHFHEMTLHGGVNLVLTRLRETFWLPSSRQLTKSIIKVCTICRRFKSKPASNPFAPLPKERMMASKPFETVGVDFAGPLYTCQDGETSKVYIMLFTCAVVRAIHLELVLNLTTENCILAIRRFIARRGAPKTIYSDNAKTFKRAATELKCLGNILDSEVFYGFLSNRGIIWRFSVERAPWWGGFWERLVKSVKDVLKATIWKSKLSNEELYTLLTEAENVINMRPLTYLSEDPFDLRPLTPSNFLAGHFEKSPSESPGLVDDSELRKKWKSRTQYVSILWKRWNVEYLRLLKAAHNTGKASSTEIQGGDVVLVYDSATPRLHWRLAVVETCFPGRDNKVRACEVRFANGKLMRRPIQLLYPLEVRRSGGPEDVENKVVS